MEGLTLILAIMFLILVLDLAAVAFGVESRGSFIDERRPSFDRP